MISELWKTCFFFNVVSCGQNKACQQTSDSKALKHQ